MVILAMLMPKQSQQLYIWLSNNDWFVLVYIGLVLLGILLSIINLHSSKDYYSDRTHEECEEINLGQIPIKHIKITKHKTINPIANIILGIIVAIGLPLIFIVIIFLLVYMLA